MGRYYNGDIEGKFWFGVQSSNDADFFGVEGYEPNYLNYYFSTEDLPNIKKGIKTCQKMLGKNKKKLDNFFKEKDSYADGELAKKLKITEDKATEILKWYARLELGTKILKCVEETGQCDFDAEL